MLQMREEVAMKNIQSGRSMIEMLGVLAIIAVLSVGGIAGYSKAMEKWKINKLISEYNDLIFGLLEYRQSFQKNIVDKFYLTDTVLSLNIVPNTWKKLNDIFLIDSYGSIVSVQYREKNNNFYLYEKEGIIVAFYPGGIIRDEGGVFISNKFNNNICFEMYQNVIKPLHKTINGVKMNKENTSYAGDAYCNNIIPCLRDMSLHQMEELCSSCDEGKHCYIEIFF